MIVRFSRLLKIRHLWQLKRVTLQHRGLICALPWHTLTSKWLVYNRLAMLRRHLQALLTCLIIIEFAFTVVIRYCDFRILTNGYRDIYYLSLIETINHRYFYFYKESFYYLPWDILPKPELNISTGSPATQHNDIRHYEILHNDIQNNNNQHYEIQHNDIQHNDIQHKEIQHYDTQQMALITMTFNIIQFSVTKIKCSTQHNNTQQNRTQGKVL